MEDKEYFNAAAREVQLQAADGYAVELDPPLAEAMGVFEETAVSEEDVEADILARREGEYE
ncbi:MAG: hypothetical protein IJD04_00360 [Desulfovibrionaceae bacterium]|nr:hypothetical protein [Desulfovibrionaceae bacterium]